MEKRRPNKKNDYDLYNLLSKKESSGEYVFKKHAKIRQKGRSISDLDILNILAGKVNREREIEIKEKINSKLAIKIGIIVLRG